MDLGVDYFADNVMSLLYGCLESISVSVIFAERRIGISVFSFEKPRLEIADKGTHQSCNLSIIERIKHSFNNNLSNIDIYLSRYFSFESQRVIFHEFILSQQIYHSLKRSHKA